MTDNGPFPSVVKRRSISERLAEKNTDKQKIVETDPTQLLSESTTTFRVDWTGELVSDKAASIPAATTAASLGELDERIARAHHLLAFSPDVLADEVEALSISVWDESGWTGPGVLHLTEGATLEGPWKIAEDLKATLGFSPEMKYSWILRANPERVAPTGIDLPTDDWSLAFPEGMPSGTELKTLLTLKRIARRLRGELRIAGSGHLIAPEHESALVLRVYSPDGLAFGALMGMLQSNGLSVALPEGAPSPSPGSPYALMIQSGDGPQVMVGATIVQEVPRVLRWEEWSANPVWIYELNWLGAVGQGLGPMSRRGRLDRRRASQTIERAAAVMAKNLDRHAVIDEDDFLIDRDELLRAIEQPHL